MKNQIPGHYTDLNWKKISKKEGCFKASKAGFVIETYKDFNNLYFRYKITNSISRLLIVDESVGWGLPYKIEYMNTISEVKRCAYNHLMTILYPLKGYKVRKF